MARHVIRNADAVRRALQNCCERREPLILVTPYLRIETAFVRIEDRELHAVATMTYEDAAFGLKTPELRMKFPLLSSFMDAPTRFLGFGVVKGRRTIRLSIPAELEDDDQRRGYRVDRVGRVTITLSTRRFDLISGTLVNLSVGGARIAVYRDFQEGEVDLDDRIPITIPLSTDIHINAKARVRYIHGRSLGLEFHPPLEGPLLEKLARWVFLKREEDIERAQNQAALQEAEGGIARRRHEGIVVASNEVVVAERIRGELEGLPEPVLVQATAQGLKEVDPASPVLILLHVARLGLDDRRRVKALLEPFQGRLPVMLVGTAHAEAGPLGELGAELKAAAVFRLGDKASPLFPRLVQGILRRHFPPEGEPGA